MSTSPRRVPLDNKPPTKKAERGALLWSILKRLGEFARPYRGLFILTLILTVLGSFTAQGNAFVLQYTIDTVDLPDPWVEGIRLLTLISVILLVKEILNVIITFGQRYFGERIRINLSRDLSQKVVDRILSYKMAFYTSDENASGKLQTRIDLGCQQPHATGAKLLY